MDEKHPNVNGERETSCRGRVPRIMRVVVHEDEFGVPIAIEAMGTIFERKPGE